MQKGVGDTRGMSNRNRLGQKTPPIGLSNTALHSVGEFGWLVSSLANSTIIVQRYFIFFHTDAKLPGNDESLSYHSFFHSTSTQSTTHWQSHCQATRDYLVQQFTSNNNRIKALWGETQEMKHRCSHNAHTIIDRITHCNSHSDWRTP